MKNGLPVQLAASARFERATPSFGGKVARLLTILHLTIWSYEQLFARRVTFPYFRFFSTMARAIVTNISFCSLVIDSKYKSSS